MIDSQIVTWTAFASLALFLWEVLIYFEFVENPFVSVLFGNSSRGNHRLRRTKDFNLESSSSFKPPIQVCAMDHLSKQSYSQTWGRMELSQSLSYSQTPSPWEHRFSGVHFLKLEIKTQDETLLKYREEVALYFLFFFLENRNSLSAAIIIRTPKSWGFSKLCLAIIISTHLNNEHGQSWNFGKNNFR